MTLLTDEETEAQRDELGLPLPPSPALWGMLGEGSGYRGAPLAILQSVSETQGLCLSLSSLWKVSFGLKGQE